MSTSVSTSPSTSQTPTPRRTPRRRSGRWRRRWWRVVIPFAVLALLVIVTLVARAVEEPDLGAAETLAPTGTGPDGSSRLAELLTQRGVQIEQVGDLQAAVAALEQDENAVLFVPKPTWAGAQLVASTAWGLTDHRVVLVAPSNVQLVLSGLPVSPGRERWASDDRLPGCAVPEAVSAGRATALHGRYTVEEPHQTCYDGGLVRTEMGGGPEVFVIGATDPFRNSRIGEHGNAQLALELLGAHDRVIWAGALPFDQNFTVPEINAPERGERNRDRGCGFACLFVDYPQPVQVGLALAALLAVLLSLARARRLGPPVGEPLPVAVPAAEVVAGRGRLYQRTQGRGVALGTLRAAALPRIVRGLGLPPAPPPEPETVVQAAAHRTGLPADHVRHILYGPAPETDEDLAQAVAALDALVAAVTRDRPRSSQGETR
jgi:hypothetical protein